MKYPSSELKKAKIIFDVIGLENINIQSRGVVINTNQNENNHLLIIDFITFLVYRYRFIINTFL